ncbi:hypothetical protein [Pseudophaeobacter flagellatus]|uniref:hypothetical protein n=1 Tax=Pseudophaeobacter flagellatus TaxID=2899119 RepID=UPI001E4F2755|nr:hypothetical protein [Pseudophaeobacter flagellatus]MCD9147661.1 hypothetical protein [Pseudophaeobacter flagellatus]
MTLVWGLRKLPVLAGGLTLVVALWALLDLIDERRRMAADLAQTQTRLRAARAELARAAAAARIHRAHLDRAADEARRWSEIINDFEKMEGRDAPLSPLLGRTAEQLFQRSPG